MGVQDLVTRPNADAPLDMCITPPDRSFNPCISPHTSNFHRLHSSRGFIATFTTMASATTIPRRNLNLHTLTRYTYFPKELFRLQDGPVVTLRSRRAPNLSNVAKIDPDHPRRERLRRAKVEVDNLKEGFVRTLGPDINF